MAIPRKQPFGRASTPGSRLADLPHLPPSLADQPGFVELDRAQRKWWDDVRTAIGDINGGTDRRLAVLAKTTIDGTSLSAAITAEQAARVAADLAEASTRSSADATLSSNISTVSAAVTSEATARASADTALSTSITTVASNLTTETTNRTNADNTLQTNINTVSAAVTTEASARASADSALSSSITTVSAALTTETTNRTNADNTLQTNINTVSAAVTTEASARASADSALSSSISTVSASVTTETTNRTNADNTLQTNINTVSAAVTTEASARASADGAIHAKWGVAIDVNNRVVGRINLDGTNQSSTFEVAVDKFVVANANGTIVAMDIRSGGKIVMGADVQSDNFSAGSAGWRIERNSGNVEFNNGTFRGSVNINAGADNQVLVDSNGISLGDRSSSRYIYASNWSVGSSSAIGWTVQHGSYHMRFGSNAYVYGLYTEYPGYAVAYVGLTPDPILRLDGGGSASIYNSGTTTLIGDLNINTSGSFPGLSNTHTGFQIEASTGTFFASRNDSFAAGHLNRNEDGAVLFFARSGSLVGSVSVTTTNTSYNTSSDARLKTAIVDAADVGSIIDALKVREYEFIRLPGKKFLGFVAQELFGVYPDAVTVGDDGEEVVRAWARDDSKLVPLLVREIQSLRARVLALETA